MREIALGRYHRIMDERRRDREGATGPERPNRREERTESGERGKEKSWRHSRHTARSLRSLWHGARDGSSFSFFLSHSLLPSLFLSAPRALSRRAFRSHTDTAGLIRVRLTYCLIIGPPRERVAGPDRPRRAAPRRAASAAFPAASSRR